MTFLLVHRGSCKYCLYPSVNMAQFSSSTRNGCLPDSVDRCQLRDAVTRLRSRLDHPHGWSAGGQRHRRLDMPCLAGHVRGGAVHRRLDHRDHVGREIPDEQKIRTGQGILQHLLREGIILFAFRFLLEFIDD